MSKRSGVFDVQVDVSKLIRGEQEKQPERSLMTLEKALRVIVRQMQVSGFRERTMKDYRCIGITLRKLRKPRICLR